MADVILDRLGIGKTLIVLAVLPTLLVSILSWTIILDANERAEDAQAREDLATRSITLGRVRATVLTELALYDLWTDDAVRVLDAELSGLADSIINPAVRSLVDGAFEQVGTPKADGDQVLLETIRDQLADLRERRIAEDPSIGPDVRRTQQLVRAGLDPDPAGRMTAEGSQSAALVQFQDYLENLVAESAIGSQILVNRTTDTTDRLRFEAAVATTDTHLGLIGRSDQPTGANLRRLLDDSSFGRIRELVFERAVGEIPVSISAFEAASLLSQATGDFADLTDAAAELADQVASAAREERNDARTQRTIALWLVGGTALLTAAISLFAGRRLTRRLARVTDVAARVSAGDLDPDPIDDTGSDDISLVANSIDQMIGTLSVVQRQLGALANGQVDDRSFDVNVPGPVGQNLRSAVDQVRRTTSQLRQRADTDALTALLNRGALEHEIEARSEAPALLLIDLDGFKAVNDELGHAAGDDVLIAVAQRLEAAVRADDLVARIGGDEFLVATWEFDAVDQIVDRISRSVAHPISTSNASATIGASIGTALPHPGEPIDETLRRADRAMYRAKANARPANV